MTSITVLYGQPTPEELAAVVTVLVAGACAAAPAVPAPPPRRTPHSAWTDRTAGLRQPLTTRFTRPRPIPPRGAV